MIGNITASRIEELMDEASKKIKLESMDIQYSSKDHDENRTAMISVKVREKDDIGGLDQFLRTSCKKDDITYVRGL